MFQIATKVGRSKSDCLDRAKELAAKIKEERNAKANAKGGLGVASAADIAKVPERMPAEWTKDEIQMLVKAVKVYPPGTQGDRWKYIADYVQLHAKTRCIMLTYLVQLSHYTHSVMTILVFRFRHLGTLCSSTQCHSLLLITSVFCGRHFISTLILTFSCF